MPRGTRRPIAGGPRQLVITSTVTTTMSVLGGKAGIPPQGCDFRFCNEARTPGGSRPQRHSITAEMWCLPCPLAYFFPLLRLA